MKHNILILMAQDRMKFKMNIPASRANIIHPSMNHRSVMGFHDSCRQYLRANEKNCAALVQTFPQRHVGGMSLAQISGTR